MKVTKFGHCCLLIEDEGLRILTDPGSYSTAQNDVRDIDVILITHEHVDHFHIPSLKNCLVNNPEARIITNKAVANLLDKEGIKYEIIEHDQEIEINGVLIEGFGDKHAQMYKTLTPVQNTGYFISNRLFYPGDALYNPNRPVDILALPVAGPWVKLSESIDYAIEINPKVAFPVHEGILKNPGSVHRIPNDILNPVGIKFIVLEEGKETEF
ncbi:MAG TPA: MBL fold metallo-hydrolase [Candidatus Nanoarchaeia archaeon]|nr:MBL fold metallo-hydrolase [Candidatus Nanoarchaeia archaeon]